MEKKNRVFRTKDIGGEWMNEWQKPKHIDKQAHTDNHPRAAHAMTKASLRQSIMKRTSKLYIQTSFTPLPLASHSKMAGNVHIADNHTPGKKPVD